MALEPAVRGLSARFIELFALVSVSKSAKFQVYENRVNCSRPDWGVGRLRILVHMALPSLETRYAMERLHAFFVFKIRGSFSPM